MFYCGDRGCKHIHVFIFGTFNCFVTYLVISIIDFLVACG